MQSLSRPQHRAQKLAGPDSGGALRVALGVFSAALLSCASTSEPTSETLRSQSEAISALEQLRSEDLSALAQLERENAQLRNDLGQAETALLATESERAAGHNRATAVSILVEARIALEQAERTVSWRPTVVEDGRAKLVEAELQLKSGHPPAALYFASRAQHIADSLIEEARSIARSPNARFVHPNRLNLRAGPSVHDPVVVVLTQGTPVFAQRLDAEWLQVRTLSGETGWVFRSLVSETASPPPAATAD